MVEYIEREALLKKMFPYGMMNDGNYGINAKAAKIAIEKMPAADVVEVSGLTPCDVCMYSPSSSGDGKPCAMCVARAKRGVEDVAPYEKGGSDAPQ